jgi:hypothetical protein
LGFLNNGDGEFGYDLSVDEFEVLEVEGNSCVPNHLVMHHSVAFYGPLSVGDVIFHPRN